MAAISIQVDGATLSALWFPAQVSTPRLIKAAVLVHGFFSDKTESGLFVPAAQRLASLGVSALAYDWRGRSDSTGQSFAHTPLETHISDFGAVSACACARAGASDQNLLGIGFSLGAVIIEAHFRRQPLGGFVGWSPAFRPALDMWPRYALPELLAAIAERGVAPKPGGDGSALMGREVLDYLRSTDCGEHALKVFVEAGAPVLLCHGTADTRIPHATTERAVEAAGGERPSALSMWLFAGASHLFRPAEQHHAALRDATAAWVDATFPGLAVTLTVK
jgi:alpha-beta hydrolase superfamily lysophospholipase